MPHDVMVTNFIVDDDTGAAQWSDDVPMYLLDLDNDADNDGSIDGDDDPIEHIPPGNIVFTNRDDDNNNGVADWVDPGPVLGEDDLAPFLIKWDHAARPDINNYLGWNVVLLFTNGGGKLWSGSDKTGPVGLEETPMGWGVHWVIGADPIPSVFYLETQSAGEIALSLYLASPEWGPVDSDVVLFTAVIDNRPPSRPMTFLNWA
jgi:hypothetical protein